MTLESTHSFTHPETKEEQEFVFGNKINYFYAKNGIGKSCFAYSLSKKPGFYVYSNKTIHQIMNNSPLKDEKITKENSKNLWDLIYTDDVNELSSFYLEISTQASKVILDNYEKEFYNKIFEKQNWKENISSKQMEEIRDLFFDKKDFEWFSWFYNENNNEFKEKLHKKTEDYQQKILKEKNKIKSNLQNFFSYFNNLKYEKQKANSIALKNDIKKIISFKSLLKDDNIIQKIDSFNDILKKLNLEASKYEKHYDAEIIELHIHYTGNYDIFLSESKKYLDIKGDVCPICFKELSIKEKKNIFSRIKNKFIVTRKNIEEILLNNKELFEIFENEKITKFMEIWNQDIIIDVTKGSKDIEEFFDKFKKSSKKLPRINKISNNINNFEEKVQEKIKEVGISLMRQALHSEKTFLIIYIMELYDSLIKNLRSIIKEEIEKKAKILTEEHFTKLKENLDNLGHSNLVEKIDYKNPIASEKDKRGYLVVTYKDGQNQPYTLSDGEKSILSLALYMAINMQKISSELTEKKKIYLILDDPVMSNDILTINKKANFFKNQVKKYINEKEDNFKLVYLTHNIDFLIFSLIAHHIEGKEFINLYKIYKKKNPEKIDIEKFFVGDIEFTTSWIKYYLKNQDKCDSILRLFACANRWNEMMFYLSEVGNIEIISIDKKLLKDQKDSLNELKKLITSEKKKSKEIKINSGIKEQIKKIVELFSKIFKLEESLDEDKLNSCLEELKDKNLKVTIMKSQKNDFIIVNVLNSLLDSYYRSNNQLYKYLRHPNKFVGRTIITSTMDYGTEE